MLCKAFFVLEKYEKEMKKLQKAQKMIRKSVSFALAVILTFVMSVTTVLADTDYSRLERLTQPSYQYTFVKDELAVVNFQPKWGDKKTNVNSMIEYIEEAHKKGTKIILFPEMCVTGYASSSNEESEIYQMPIKNAEDLDGPTQKTIAALSDKYDMWVIYGGTQKVYNDNKTVDTKHAYNSAFACSPEGKVTAYQKITPVEGAWCKAGTTPVLLDAGKYGKIGLSICYDTYATPELGRYYAAKGANILLNPTATSRSYRSDNDKGWEWYYKNRLESGASREGYTILSSNLVGKDGPNENYNFPGGSIILKAVFNGPTYYAGTTDTEVKANEKADILTGKEGLLTNMEKITCATGSTCSNKDFNPEMYATLYKRLATKKANGASLSYSSKVTDGPKAAVVNMAGVWGDKETNINNMKKYVEEAAAQDVDILVFPETVLTGYEYQKPKDGEDAMQVKLAELIPGPTTKKFSELAQKYDMYIIFGMTEKDKSGPIYENGVEKVYNSAAICMPDGTIDSYRKIHRAGAEDQWSVPGENPKMFETKWGKVGIDICRDGHFYPELGRYYAAMGCTLFIHPTATTGNPWYRETRIGSYTDRDGMAAITCNLLGPDGTLQSDGTYSGGIFNSTSLIITKQQHGFNTETGSAIDLNGTGSESEGYEERKTSPEGLEVATMNLNGCGFRISNFNPDLFSRMYDDLAKDYRAGYTSLYSESINQPETIDLSENKTVNTVTVTFKGTSEKTVKVMKNVKTGTKLPAWSKAQYKAAGKKGYIFAGWTYNGKVITTVPSVKEKVTLTAKFVKLSVGQAKSLSVKGKSGKGVGFVATSQKYTKTDGSRRGFTYRYATNSKMKNAKTNTTGIAKNVYTKTGLKKGNKYYIQVRYYYYDSTNQRVYGAYSKAKSVKAY